MGASKEFKKLVSMAQWTQPCLRHWSMAINGGISMVGKRYFLSFMDNSYHCINPVGLLRHLSYVGVHPKRANILAQSMVFVGGGSPWESQVTVVSGV